jgi:cytochrome oxidase Cu insertion factor (SCO1/SenC/PrrC family)
MFVRIRMKYRSKMSAAMMRSARRFAARPKRLIVQTPIRLAFAIALLGITAFGCDSNTAPIPDEPAQSSSGPSNGSFASSNDADCLPTIALVDQHGAKVSLAALKGKPVLIDFIYANCDSACPLMTARFAQIAGRLGSNLGTKVTMVSITIDPEHDHPAQLLDYAKTHAADRDGWLLLTGKPADIDAVLHIYGLKREREADGSVAHVTTSFLVGPNGRQIRMYATLEVTPDTVVGDIDRALPKG